MNKMILILMLAFSVFSQAQTAGLVERVVEVTIKKSEAKNFPTTAVGAKKALSDMTIDKVSSDVILEMIGESKFSRNKQLIQSKIIKNSSRYIPYVKFGEVATQTTAKTTDIESYKMASQLKISLEDLKALLLEQGLLYEFDGTPAIVPMVSWTDQLNVKSYAWWSPQEKNQLWSSEQRFEEKLKNEMQEKGFYSYKPQVAGVYELLPDNVRSLKVDIDRWMPTLKWLSAQIVILGDFEISKKDAGFEVVARLSAIQVSNGRQIADIVRRFENLNGRSDFQIQRKLIEVLDEVTDDLSTQVLEAWQKGSIGASVYQLVIEGRVPIQIQEGIKDVLQFKAKEIKNIRERVVASDEIIYEIDSSISPVLLAQKLKSFEVSGTLFEVDGSNEARVSYRMKAAK